MFSIPTKVKEYALIYMCATGISQGYITKLALIKKVLTFYLSLEVCVCVCQRVSKLFNNNKYVGLESLAIVIVETLVTIGMKL